MPEIISESLPLWVELLLFAILSLSLCWAPSVEAGFSSFVM
jgi:hypothetical protein